jgi:hypothetical protein
VNDPPEFGTNRRASDQLSDYGCADGHQSAHVHALLSRSTTVARGAPILVRDEEVAGSCSSKVQQQPTHCMTS